MVDFGTALTSHSPPWYSAVDRQAHDSCTLGSTPDRLSDLRVTSTTQSPNRVIAVYGLEEVEAEEEGSIGGSLGGILPCRWLGYVSPSCLNAYLDFMSLPATGVDAIARATSCHEARCPSFVGPGGLL